MKKIILGIGIPGSGKTTVLKKFAEKYDYKYICADDVRSDLGIDHNDPLIASDNQLTLSIWDKIRKQVTQTLAEGKTVVLDATFASLELRREFIEIAHQNHVEKVQGVFLDTPSKIAWERSEKRDRKVPRHVFDKRLRDLKDNPPQTNDGFDAIFTINEYDNLFKTETSTAKKEFTYKRPLY